jgi:hypothetical protein
VAAELSINLQNLHKWKAEFKQLPAGQVAGTLEALQAENVWLRQKLDALARRFFGVSSEALNPAQPLLQMPELAAQPVENAPAPAVVEPRKGTGEDDCTGGLLGACAPEVP